MTDVEAIVEEGQKLERKWRWFYPSKYEDAAAIYQKAANIAKVHNDYQTAATILDLAAKAFTKGGDSFLAGRCYEEAGDCLVEDPEFKEGVKDYYDAAFDKFIEAGQHGLAYKIKYKLAEYYKKRQEYSSAISAFGSALEFYQNMNPGKNDSNVRSCLEELGFLYVETKVWSKAAKIFERLGFLTSGKKLLKWTASRYFLKCVCCCLAGDDSVAAERQILKFEKLDTLFRSQLEFKVSKDLIVAFEIRSYKDYEKAVEKLRINDYTLKTVLLEIRDKIDDDLC